MKKMISLINTMMLKNGTIKTIINTTTNGSYHVIIYYIDFLNNFLRNLEEWVDKKDI